MSNLFDVNRLIDWLRAKVEALTKVKLPALPADKNLRADWGKLFEVWFRETSPPLQGGTWSGGDTVTFADTSPYTLDLIDSPGMAEVRQKFCAAGKGRRNPFPGVFSFTGPGSGKKDYYTMVEWFLGSFSGDVIWKDLGGGRFDIRMDAKNTSGWYSGTRLPQSWTNRIKQLTGLEPHTFFGEDKKTADAPRGQVTDQKLRALVRKAANHLPSLDLPDWGPFAGKKIDPKTWIDVGDLPHLPSFGGNFYQTFRVRTEWTCDK